MFSTVELMWFVELKRVVFKIILLRSWSRDANYTARLLQNRAFLEAKYNAHQHSRRAERMGEEEGSAIQRYFTVSSTTIRI